MSALYEIRKAGKMYSQLKEKLIWFLTHIDPLSQVNFSIAINRVNTVEDSGECCAAPDEDNEEDDVQEVVSHINVHIDREDL